ncbi:MAG: 4-(cytidine 5'-diphospho)-2-C-methyl-D-erythritol kinase [Gammaproteobacteria bacterium]|nr:4-(cytidine 5'-diphospho)-2-C-methyl-D-erythritol kinase [Gammaproteobacteria bacterium]
MRVREGAAADAPGPDYWPAPAKLNLFLHVVGRRADGYHLLQTCFQFVDLCDDIGLRVREDGRIHRVQGAEGVPADQDLCVRAARALQQAAGIARGADIEVRKRIPMGAGLGGGSSDAATTLLGLNRLWRCGFSAERLAEIGLSLGADVPVFVHGHAAFAEGIGERLAPMTPPESIYLILKPKVSISTAEVFKDPELTRNTPPITIAGFLQSGGHNDCEPVVRRRYPEVGRALDHLARFGRARLTGTGACVFLDCESERRGREIMRQTPTEWDSFLVRGLNESPMRRVLQSGGTADFTGKIAN